MKYEIVIGLEVHVQLKTKSKIFCKCSTLYGAEANTQVCPICLGMPGTLPVLNKQVVEYAIKTALAMNCNINKNNRFARKNYFYPDLPKGYQISQFDYPLAEGGYLEIYINNKAKKIQLTRIHLEEDSGKSLHPELAHGIKNTYVDMNRCGMPLIEIVSEPDMRSPEEAYLYLTSLKQILEYLEVSDCNMDEGSLRCDANISLRLAGEEYGTQTEVKNMNSFRNVQRALEYEIKRQAEVLDNGGKIEKQTLLFDDKSGMCHPMRSKEYAHDYRYFPEPDLVFLDIEDEWIEDVRKTLPELPAAKKRRFMAKPNSDDIKTDEFLYKYWLRAYDAEVLIATRELVDYYKKCVYIFYRETKIPPEILKLKENMPPISSRRLYPDYEHPDIDTTKKSLIANWIINELLGVLKEKKLSIAQSSIKPKDLAELIKLITTGWILGKNAKIIFKEMVNTGKSAYIIAIEKKLLRDTKWDLEKIIAEILQNSSKEIEQYKKNPRVIGYFVGQVMKATKGKADPMMINDILNKQLTKIIKNN